MSVMTLQFVNETDPLAVCNDGTSAGFYYAPSVNGSNLWLVYAEGSMFCFDQRRRARPGSPRFLPLRSLHLQLY